MSRDVALVEALVAARRWAVLAVPAAPDDADEPVAGAAADWPAGAIAVPPHARAVTAINAAITTSAVVRVLDSEFITFLPRFVKFTIA